ncbi:unnamed protein product [Paramecium pentaurelia]|uniref:Transmembrane protein n=1 Tax=Paramecium pentaurelia TaxID=43138 RepID=A0A8S1YEI0_9CILI|nr:unnamed protein product [Paramecium pentaurelia]
MCQRLFRCFGLFSDSHLDKKPHTQINYKSDFQEIIETRLIEVKGCLSIMKYYAKIGFQAFLYLSSVLELIFTLIYCSYNNISDETVYYEICYNLSIILCVSIHSGVWIYTYHFKKAVEHSIFVEITNYIYYMLFGILSYFKLAPFIIYYNRDQSIKQFSFSQINKYQKLSYEDKQRNPCRLFKDRKKTINIFRDFIFHRVALLSMIIMITFQTIPQLVIQGLFNQLKGSWDGFNIICYGLLGINFINFFFEFQFILYSKSNSQLQTNINYTFTLKDIELKFIQESKQLYQSNFKYLAFVKSCYFHINPSKFTPYQKKKCMFQIIGFLLKQKQYQNIQFHFIDKYEQDTLQYLANCFKFINVEKICLLYHEENSLILLKGIFKSIPNLKFYPQALQYFDYIWLVKDAYEELNNNQEIQFIGNPKITVGWQDEQKSQFIKNEYITISKEFQELISNFKKRRQSDLNKIFNQANDKIDAYDKTDFFLESVGDNYCLYKLYRFYHYQLKKLYCYQNYIKTAWDFILYILSFVYVSVYDNTFTKAILFLAIINVIYQILSYTIFQQVVFKAFSIQTQLSHVLIFTLSACVQTWEMFERILKKDLKHFAGVNRYFGSQTCNKFKYYASKLKGNVANQIFNFEDKFQIKDDLKFQPQFEAIVWRINTEDVYNKIAQIFLYILSLQYDHLDALWAFAFIRLLLDTIERLIDFLEVIILDYLIPALILSKVSVDQFYSSMFYLNTISNQIILEHPKSFSIISKVELFHSQVHNCKINLKTLNYSQYYGLKKMKMLAYFQKGLLIIKSILEIDQAQKLFCMGSELDDLISCLKVSQIYQLKLNYYLDEVNPIHIPHINVIIRNCPKQLKFLQLQVEATDEHQMEFCVKRKKTLIAFSYSYFQIIQQYRNNDAQVEIEINLNINENFLKLDRYNFEEFYFEVSGNLILNNCEQLFAKFNYLKLFKASIINKGTIQIFQFSNNLRSQQLETLDITFENIKLDFQEYNFKNLLRIKMILINCEFNNDELREKLETLNEQTNEIYIDMSQCLLRFTRDQQRDLIKKLEQQGTDVVIKI